MDKLEEDIFLPGGYEERPISSSRSFLDQNRDVSTYAVAVFQFLVTFLVLYSLRPDFLLTKNESLHREEISLPLALAISLGVTFATYFYSS